MSKNVFELGFCIGKGDNPKKSLTWDSGKVVDFFQRLDTWYAFLIVWCWFYEF